MRKVIKYFLSLLSFLVIVLLALPVTLALVFNIGAVQNSIAKRAASYAASVTGTHISIGEIKIRGYNTLLATDLYAEDHQGDTLIYAHKLKASISIRNILFGRVRLPEARLDSVKVFLYQPSDDDVNITKVIDAFIDPDREDTSEEPIVLENVAIYNAEFRYRSDRSYTPMPEQMMDFQDMVLKDLNITSDKLTIKGDKVLFDNLWLQFVDKCGFRVDSMTSDVFEVDGSRLLFANCRIISGISNIWLQALSLNADTWQAYGDYYDSVPMNIKLRRTDIDASTLSYFVPWVNRNSNVFLKNITVSFEGIVNDFSGEIGYLGNSELNMAGRYAVRDIMRPDIAEFDILLTNVETGGKETVRLMDELKLLTTVELSPRTTAIFERFGNYKFAGTIKGRYDNFNAEGKFQTDAGEINANIDFGLPKGHTLMNGKIDAERFKAGHVLNVPVLGDISFGGDLKADITDSYNKISTSVHISSIELNGNAYTGVILNGTYDNDRFTGGVTSLDPDLAFKADGEFVFGEDIPTFDLDLHLRSVDLRKLGINTRNSSARLALLARMKGSGSGLDNFNGMVTVNDLAFIKQRDTIFIDSIVLQGENNPYSKRMVLSSPVVDAEYRGTESYGMITDYFQRLFNNYLPALGEEIKAAASGTSVSKTDGADEPKESEESVKEIRNSSLTIKVKHSDELADLFPDNLHVADNTGLNLVFNPHDSFVILNAESDYIEYASTLFTKVSMRADNLNAEQILKLDFSTEDIYTNSFTMPAMNIGAELKDNNLNLYADISNEKTDIYARLNIQSVVSKSDGGEMVLTTRVLPSTLYTINQSWNIASEPVIYSGSKVVINNFSVSSGDQLLSIDGVMSDNKADTLSVGLLNFDIALLSDLMHIEGYDIGGIADGYAKVASANRDARVTSNISFEQIRINSIDIAPLYFRSLWDSADENLLFELKNTETESSLVRGVFKPKNGEYTVKADIKNVPMAFIEPALSGAITDTRGEMAVNIKAEGDKESARINGEVTVSDLSTRMEMNNVTYSIQDTAAFTIKNNMLELADCRIRDHEGNEAVLSAAVDMRSLYNISYKALLETPKIKILNTNSAHNPLYYGDVYARGRIIGDGNKMGISIGGDIAVTDNSAITAMLAGPSSVVNSDFITFQSKNRQSDPTDKLSIKKLMYERMLRNQDGGRRSNINIMANLYIGNDTNIMLLFDAAGDNRLMMNGSAMLNLSFNPRHNDFNVYGSYDIDDGRFMFNFRNVIVDKMFVLQPGGTIQWTGDPLDAILHVKGIYNLKASLAPIATSTELSKSGRVPVECIISVTDRLSQPNLEFDVNVVTTDATVQNSLNSLLATQEMIATQFSWLLLFNNFYADSTYGQSENIGTMGTTSIGFDFLTSQISSWISSDNTNIILRYRAHDVYNSDEIDVGISKELLDSRLILEVEGNFDTGNNSASTVSDNQKGNVSGDASITWLINNSGNLRIKGFTRTIDRFDENQNLQENGLGIYYREDFNSFSDIGDRYKRRRAERKRLRTERREAKNGVNAETEAPTDTEDISD